MEQVRRETGWRPTARDQAILRQMGEHGFSSAKWIRECFSKEKSNCNHYRRLSILRKKGLIENLVGDAGTKLGYRLTKKGLALLRSLNPQGQGDHSPDQGVEIEYRAAYRTTYNHDDDLVGLGTVFRMFPGVVEYWPEHLVRQRLSLKHGYKERKRDGFKVPDALFAVQTKQRLLRIALELEVALKARAYYRRILRQLATSSDFDMVFVIVKDSKMLDRLEKELTWVRANDPGVKFAKRDNGFYFALLADVLNEKGNAKFRGEGTAFTLAELAT